jgi:TolB-like protein/Tfp pilus assembly protein PilF
MLAVLPFENLSGDPEQEYFSNGLTEEMITTLGRLDPGTLGVIARTSAMQYKGARKNTRQIANELGVDYILEGSVRREGMRVRITAQLIQAGDQSHLWAENYDRDLRDVLSMQSEVAGSIAQQIRLRLSPEQDARLKNTHPLNPDAYENYLKGRFFWNKRTVEGYGKAIEFFANAIALDPNFAQAYAGMADAYALLGSAHDMFPRSDAMMRAREAAKTALGLDETLADAHTSLAFVTMHYDWDFATAEKQFRRAISLNPGYATAHHWYAYNLVALGRLEDAIAEIRLAQKTDPLSVIIGRDVGEILLFAGRDEEAIAQSRKTLEMDPNFDGAHWVLAWAYHRKGRSKEFIEELEKSGSTGITLGLSAFVLALKGQREKAERLLPAFEKNLPGIMEATVYAYLGDKDRAFASLEKVFANRDGGLIVMRVAPDLEQLRSDPRFERLARRVGLPNR